MNKGALDVNRQVLLLVLVMVTNICGPDTIEMEARSRRGTAMAIYNMYKASGSRGENLRLDEFSLEKTGISVWRWTSIAPR